MWYSLSAKEKLGAASLLAAVLGGAAWVGFQRLTTEPATSFRPMLSTASSGAGEFPVHVAGAVSEPGVISANPNMLAQDAINAAGGATEEADLGKINLAARLEPNSRLYVPANGETVDAGELGVYGPRPTAPTFGGGAPPGSYSGLININTAGEAELDRLPGVGPVTA